MSELDDRAETVRVVLQSVGWRFVNPNLTADERVALEAEHRSWILTQLKEVEKAGRIAGLEEAAGIADRLPNAITSGRGSNRKIDEGTRNICSMISHAVRAAIETIKKQEE